MHSLEEFNMLSSQYKWGKPYTTSTANLRYDIGEMESKGYYLLGPDETVQVGSFMYDGDQVLEIMSNWHGTGKKAKDVEHPVYFRVATENAAFDPADFSWQDCFRSKKYPTWSHAIQHAQGKGFVILSGHEVTRRGDVYMNEYNNLRLLKKILGHSARSYPFPVYRAKVPSPEYQSPGFNWSASNKKMSTWQEEIAFAEKLGCRLFHPEELIPDNSQFFVLSTKQDSVDLFLRDASGWFSHGNYKACSIMYPVYAECETCESLTEDVVCTKAEEEPLFAWLRMARHLNIV